MHGETTDSSGFISDLKDKNIELSSKKVLIIGAGDATESILWGITKQKPKELFVINRTVEKAERLAKKAQEKKISKVFFDRGNYKYHGRIKSFAEILRKNGLIF